MFSSISSLDSLNKRVVGRVGRSRVDSGRLEVVFNLCVDQALKAACRAGDSMAEQEHQERGGRIKDTIRFIEVTSPIDLSQVSKVQDSNQV